MKKLLSTFTVITALFLSCLSPVLSQDYASAESDDVIFSSDFDDGNINEWSAFGGGGKLSLDTSVSHSGENSMRVTDRSEAYHGPSLTADSLFTPEKVYNFSAWAYQKSDSVKTLLWTLKYVDSVGKTEYMQIASADLQSGTWTLLTGTITIPEDSVSYLMYFECANATVEFCIDDVVITGDRNNIEERGTDKKGYLYSFDFESGNELWGPRGDNSLVRTDEYSNTGSHSIYVTNRTKTWNGPTVNINDVKRDTEYFYSAYVMYNGEEYEDSHDFRMEVQYNLNGETVYQLIREQNVKKHKWTRIAGTYTIPEGAADVSFYLQTANIEDENNYTLNDLMSFYTDSVIISEASNIHKKTAIIVFVVSVISVVLLLILRHIFLIVAKRSKKKKAALNSITKDAMTQCYNRNAYEKRIAELENDSEKCKSLYFTLCDVNFLKYINDNHGHEKGDEAITRCGQMLMDAVGSDGMVYRTGGDEFVCISSKPVQEKIRDAIEHESAIDKGYPFAVASGFAEYDPELDTDKPDINVIIERSDKEMYINKQEIKSKNPDYSRK